MTDIKQYLLQIFLIFLLPDELQQFQIELVFLGKRLVPVRFHHLKIVEPRAKSPHQAELACAEYQRTPREGPLGILILWVLHPHIIAPDSGERERRAMPWPGKAPLSGQNGPAPCPA